MLAQALKRYARRRVIGVVRRIVRGTEETVQTRLSSTQGNEKAVINTAYIERLQATLRSRLAPLARRTRAAVRQRGTLEGGHVVNRDGLQLLRRASLSEGTIERAR